MSFKISDSLDVGNAMCLLFFSQQPGEVGIAVLSFPESSSDSSAEIRVETKARSCQTLHACLFITQVAFTGLGSVT